MTKVFVECAWSPWRWYWASNMFSKFQCWSFGALYQDTIGQDRPYWILIRREVLSIFLERYDKISLWTFKEFIIFTSFEIPLWLLDFFVAVKTVGVGRSSLLYSRGCFNPRVHINSTRNICGVHFSESSLKICNTISARGITLKSDVPACCFQNLKVYYVYSWQTPLYFDIPILKIPVDWRSSPSISFNVLWTSIIARRYQLVWQSKIGGPLSTMA